MAVREPPDGVLVIAELPQDLGRVLADQRRPARDGRAVALPPPWQPPPPATPGPPGGAGAGGAPAWGSRARRSSAGSARVRAESASMSASRCSTRFGLPA